MLTKRIIPCLDIQEGKVVKGTQFLDIQQMGEPLEMAAMYEKDGADELCFLDILASHEKRKIFIDLVERIAETIFIPFTVGGGLSSLGDCEEVLLRGADKISINTAAFCNPKLISKAAHRFGSQCVVVAVDAKRIGTNADADAQKKQGESKVEHEVFLYGGRKGTGVTVREWVAKAADLGAGEILLTSMDQDGTEAGYDHALIDAATQVCSLPVIASGGAGSVQHIVEGMQQTEAQAYLAARIFHEGKMRLCHLKEELLAHGLPIRPPA